MRSRFGVGVLALSVFLSSQSAVDVLVVVVVVVTVGRTPDLATLLLAARSFSPSRIYRFFPQHCGPECVCLYVRVCVLST